MQYITALKLYDYTRCLHKVWRDIYGPQEEKIKETNPFVQLLWENGILHEETAVKNLDKYLDIRKGTYEERIKVTIAASGKKSAFNISRGIKA